MSNLPALDLKIEVDLPETAIFLKRRPILSKISRNRKKGERSDPSLAVKPADAKGRVVPRSPGALFHLLQVNVEAVHAQVQLRRRPGRPGTRPRTALRRSATA